MNNFKDDIEKYLKGRLSPAEMHKLEMKALNDPFLAEALEGAESISANEFSEDIKLINKKIHTSSRTRYIWTLRIAASILLLISIAYIFIKYEETEPQELTLQNKKEMQSPAVVTDSVKDDSKIENENLLSFNSEKKDKERAQKPSSDDTQPSVKRTNDESPASTEETKPIEEALEEPKLITKAEERELAPEQIQSQSQGFTELKKESRRVRTEAFKSVSPSSTSNAGAALAKEDDSQDVVSPNPPDYEIYLKSNLKYPQAAIANKIEGEVIINFTVNSDGTPGDFQIEKSIGYGCDEELIRLVKEGPKWQTTTKDGKVIKSRSKVAFTFKLPN